MEKEEEAEDGKGVMRKLQIIYPKLGLLPPWSSYLLTTLFL